MYEPPKEWLKKAWVNDDPEAVRWGDQCEKHTGHILKRGTHYSNTEIAGVLIAGQFSAACYTRFCVGCGQYVHRNGQDWEPSGVCPVNPPDKESADV